MQPRTLYFISILVVYATFVFAFNTTILSDVLEEKPIDCRNPDYKSHIKCWVRQKRLHDNGDNCLEFCRKRCEVWHDCDKKCSYCNVKAKQRHQIITEYESECNNNDCKKEESVPAAVNITTKIDIHNVIESNCEKYNHTPSVHNCCPTCQPPVPCTPYFPLPPPPPPPMPSWNICQVPSMLWMCYPSMTQSVDCTECTLPYNVQCSIACSFSQSTMRGR